MIWWGTIDVFSCILGPLFDLQWWEVLNEKPVENIIFAGLLKPTPDFVGGVPSVCVSRDEVFLSRPSNTHATELNNATQAFGVIVNRRLRTGIYRHYWKAVWLQTRRGHGKNCTKLSSCRKAYFLMERQLATGSRIPFRLWFLAIVTMELAGHHRKYWLSTGPQC